MANNKGQMGTIITLVVILLLVVVGYYLYSSGTLGNLGTSSSQGSGRVVFAVTDAAANMGSVSKVLVTVDDVQAHSTTEGWVTISSTSKTYDLLELKSSGELALVADTNVKAGSYDQVRLDVSKVVVVDSTGEHEAKLPSNELKINTNLEVNANQTSTATFDFIADESLHITGNGKYILAPVIQVETRSDTEVNEKGNSRVEINGGSVKSKAKVGMDVNGNVGVGLNIPASLDLDIDASGKVKVGKALGLSVGNSEKSNNSANSNGKAKVEVSGSSGSSGSGY